MIDVKCATTVKTRLRGVTTASVISARMSTMIARLSVMTDSRSAMKFQMFVTTSLLNATGLVVVLSSLSIARSRMGTALLSSPTMIVRRSRIMIARSSRMTARRSSLMIVRSDAMMGVTSLLIDAISDPEMIARLDVTFTLLPAMIVTAGMTSLWIKTMLGDAKTARCGAIRVPMIVSLDEMVLRIVSAQLLATTESRMKELLVMELQVETDDLDLHPARASAARRLPDTAPLGMNSLLKAGISSPVSVVRRRSSRTKATISAATLRVRTASTRSRLRAARSPLLVVASVVPRSRHESQALMSVRARVILRAKAVTSTRRVTMIVVVRASAVAMMICRLRLLRSVHGPCRRHLRARAPRWLAVNAESLQRAQRSLPTIHLPVWTS